MQHITAVFVKRVNLLTLKNNYVYQNLTDFASRFREALGNMSHEGLGYELHINIENPILLTCLWVGDGFLNCFTGQVTVFDALMKEEILLRHYKSVLRKVVIKEDCPLPAFAVRCIMRECELNNIVFKNLQAHDQSD
jgi:hypothetical protein